MNAALDPFQQAPNDNENQASKKANLDVNSEPICLKRVVCDLSSQYAMLNSLNSFNILWRV